MNVLINSNFGQVSEKRCLLNMTIAEDDEMALSEHIEEFSQRVVFCVLLLVLATLFCFTDVKEIVRIFQAPAVGVKFLTICAWRILFCFCKNCRILWDFI